MAETASKTPSATQRTRRAAKPDPALWPRSGMHLEPLSLRRAPVLWAAVCFCAGAWASHGGWRPVALWLAAAMLLLGAAAGCLRVRASGRWIGCMPVAALWMVVGFGATEVQPAPAAQTELSRFADGLSRTVQGRVTRVRTLQAEPPREGADSDGFQEAEAPPVLAIDLAVDAVEEVTPDVSRMAPVAGGVRATVVGDAGSPGLTLGCGEILSAPMRLRMPQRYRDPGAWQYADYLLDQGIVARATVHARSIAMGSAPSSPGGETRAEELRCRLFAAQGWAAARMLGYAGSAANAALPRLLRLSAEDAGMLNAMLFGDRAGLNRPLRVGFERTGSFHLFVVSGMHVALIALGLFWLAGRMRMPLWAATLGTLGVTAGYAALTGFGVPVQRALWMAAIFLLARLFDRQRNTLNALGLAILGVLVWSPSSLFEASFQMTFLAVVGVAGIAVPLGERTILPFARAARGLDEVWRDVHLEPRLAQFRVLLRLAADEVARLLGRWARWIPAFVVRFSLYALEMCLIGIVTEMVMTLPMAVYFHRATLFALPANLMSVPIVGLLVPAALGTFCLSLASPWAATVPGSLTSLLLHGIRGAVGRIASARQADLRVPEPAVWACLAAAACVALSVWAVRRRGTRWGWLAVALLPCAVAIVLWPEPQIAARGMLEVTAIDVGQGDSLLVHGPGGGTMLVDAGGALGYSGRGGAGGSRQEQTASFDVGEEIVSPYLWSRRIRRLDVVALTHEHSDHMGGMPAVLENFRPRELWVGVDVPSEAYAAMLREAAALEVQVRHYHAGDRVAWDGVEVSVLGPEPGYENMAAPRNDDSLVMRLEFGGSSVLLEGDAQRVEERAMLDHGRVAPVTLLKAGHHGSATSSTEEFLARASPRMAVISVGRGNTFGHPRPEVVARFAQRGVRLYRTDMFGLTTFLLGRDGGIQAFAGASNEEFR